MVRQAPFPDKGQDARVKYLLSFARRYGPLMQRAGVTKEYQEHLQVSRPRAR